PSGLAKKGGIPGGGGGELLDASTRPPLSSAAAVWMRSGSGPGGGRASPVDSEPALSAWEVFHDHAV
ncbi:hypothetical protein, partial [Microbispora sp. ATCC PTA-5024]|uniref:hypothetical protein n=1 Tax=Microbispora sp. ATCC PTA-5024 TaxID=316330 RepID=UPI001E286488